MYSREYDDRGADLDSTNCLYLTTVSPRLFIVPRNGGYYGTIFAKRRYSPLQLRP